MFNKNIPNTKYQIPNTNFGFTLLETIITLFIITLMLALFLTSYRNGSRTSDLTFATQKLASDIRLAQNNALGSVYYNGAPPTGGWGVHLDKTPGNNNSYYIFADNNAVIGNRIYDSGEADPTKGGQAIFLPANVLITDLTDALGTSHNQLDITFSPPDPTTGIYWLSNASTTSATVTLQESASGATKKINVNILGLIEAP